MLRPSGWKPTPQQQDRMLAFEGYGVDEPDIVFVGLEEYCSPDPDDQRENVWLRCTDPLFESPRVDKNGACRVLGRVTRIEGVGTWNMMARILSALTGDSESHELDALGSRPARGKRSTLVTELRPLPRPSTKDFRSTYIPEWFPFSSKGEYERGAESRASARLMEALRKGSPPGYAFFYGLPASRWAQEHLGGDTRGGFQEVGKYVRVGVSKAGTRIALTGFYDGQHGASAFRSHHIPNLISRLREMA